MENTRPLTPDKYRQSLIIDDIPVPSPKKDFNTLLEEQLKDTDPTENQPTKTKRKFPFLKKGQGLARFRPNPENPRLRVRSRSLPARTVSPKVAPKPKAPTKSARTSEPLRRPSLPPKNSPKNIINKKPVVPKNVSSDLNSSDPDAKTIKELEEVRIFELMEEKAENSSFCSNSSTVLAFMQQSSPLRNQLFTQIMAGQSRRTLNQGQQELVCQTNILTYGTEVDSVKWENFDLPPRQSQLRLINEENVVCELPYGIDVLSDDEKDLDKSKESLHVRFAEFNEYKTIGISDVSTISTDSRMDDNYTDQAWSECSTTDSSETESQLDIINKLDGSEMRKSLMKQFCQQNPENDIDSYDDESSSAKVTDDDIDDDDYSSKSSHDDTLLENNQPRSTMNNQQDEPVILQPEILKTRLNDLEREIEAFRSENMALKIQRQKLDEQHKELEKSKREYEMEKLRVAESLDKEKKRLERQKAALDSRLKDAREKANKSRQEREEIINLKQQLDLVKEEMYQKENKWQAAQARHKSQVRVLMTQNKELKEEIERLEKLKLERQKSRKPNTVAKNKTRAIHEINRLLQSNAQPRNKYFSSEDEGVGHSEPSPELSVRQIDNQEQKQAEEPPFNIDRQRNLYATLIKDASIGIAEYEKAKRSAEEQCKSAMKETMENNDSTDSQSQVKISEKRHALNLSQNTETSAKIQKSLLKNVKEIKEVDGHFEHWYSNGNVLKIFPDTNLKKLIYYNGDVKETDAEGKIRYYYASSRTWHTTMPDGGELFQYPDGRVEKRTKTGTTEISYPDGSVKIWEANGLEKWTLPDGTLVETLADGTKVFNFRNGQREIHTKDQKRRDYPDGTVKTVYTDGTQETRYSNGRIRLKDKDGYLIMDSHQQNKN